MNVKDRGERVIVIGAGLGGMSAAISLATEGYRVDLYEKNEHVGGKLNVQTVAGYTFDLGPSILILPHIFQRLWTRAGRRMEDYLDLEELKPHWRCFFDDRTTVDLHPDVRVMERELAKFSPSDSDGYYAYLDYSRRLWKFCEEAYLDRASESSWSIARGYGLREILKRADYLTSSMAQGVARYVRSEKLRTMLGFFVKYVGSSAYEAPAIYNLLAYSQLGYGAWYVSGGMYNLAMGLRRLAEELGVGIHLSREVTRIKVTEGAASGVVLADGSEEGAALVVSNMEVIPAYRTLLGEDPEGSLLQEYEKRFEPSCSGLVVHLGLDREYPQLAHHNFFFSRNQKKHFESVYRKYELPADPTIYLVAPTRTDKRLAPAGHEILKLLPHIPHLQDPPFTAEDYRRLKETLYAKLEHMGLEDLRKHIVVEEMLTPEDIERMYYSNKGSIYGVVASRKKNKGLRAPKRSEKYGNLYFVGGSVNPGSGMPMAVYSGQMVRDMVVRDRP